MAVASVTTKPKIVKLGGAYEERHAYTAGGVDTIYAGDLIRLNSSGTIDVAEGTSAGAVHGIALEANAASAVVLPVIMFASDTIVEIQCVDTVAPEDLTKGLVYALEVSTANKQAINASTSTPIATVVDYAATGQPFEDRTGTFDQTDSTNNNSVLVRFSTTVLEGHAAAAS